ncbi:MAG: MBL fold metallo-hydrolase [Flavobacteriia bacterium]|nr:MBL fold metallo-hydrolase [Flavobacteriia bacterium]
MKTLKLLTLWSLFFCHTNLVKAQEIQIIPIEHASAVITAQNKTIFIDPVGEASWYENHHTPDLILITDIHWDHFSPKTLGAIVGENTKIVAPKAVVDKMTPALLSITSVIANGESQAIMDIVIQAIPMYNLRAEALDFHTKGRGNGYVIEWGGKRLYFSGDTEDIPEMRALKDIDMAFVCMNLPYTMTETAAASGVLEFAPKAVYPYHYRGKPNVSDVALFKSMIQKGNSEIQVIQLDWYPRDTY